MIWFNIIYLFLFVCVDHQYQKLLHINILPIVLRGTQTRRHNQNLWPDELPLLEYSVIYRQNCLSCHLQLKPRWTHNIDKIEIKYEKYKMTFFKMQIKIKQTAIHCQIHSVHCIPYQMINFNSKPEWLNMTLLWSFSFSQRKSFVQARST